MGAKVWKRADTGPAQPPVPGAEQLVAGPGTSSQKLPARRVSNTEAPSGHPVGNAGAPHRPTQAHQQANTSAHHTQRSQPANAPRHHGPPTQRPHHPRQPAASGDAGTSSQAHHTAKPRRSTDAGGPPNKRQKTDAAPEKQHKQQQEQQEKPKPEQSADPLGELPNACHTTLQQCLLLIASIQASCNTQQHWQHWQLQACSTTYAPH